MHPLSTTSTTPYLCFRAVAYQGKRRMADTKPALADSNRSLLSGVVDNNGGGLKKSFHFNDLSGPSIAGVFKVGDAAVR